MKSPITNALAGLAAAGLIAALAAPALAHAAVPDAKAEVVRFADLDLASPAGAHTLYARIYNAAREVCGPSEIIGVRSSVSAWQDCVAASVNQAVRSVNRPLLTAYYTDRLRAAAFKAPGSHSPADG